MSQHQGYLPAASGGAVDEQWNGTYDSVVAVATDPLNQGRVRLSIPQVLGNAFSNWAQPMQPGLNPVVGQRVFAIFLGGNPDLPYYFLGLTATTLQNLTNNTGLVLNSNPYFTGNVIDGWTGTGGTVIANSPNSDTNPPYVYGILWTATGSGGGYISEASAQFAAGAAQPYQVSAWVYYPLGGTVNLGCGFATAAHGALTPQTNPFTVPASTWTQLSTVVTSPGTTAFGWPIVGPATSTTGEQFTAEAVQVIGQIPGALIEPGTITTTQLGAGVTARALGGITTTIAASAPASPTTSDVWINTTLGYQLNIYSGSAWVPVAFNATDVLTVGTIIGSLIAANTITASNIAAGTITAAQIQTGTITATQIANNTITAAQIAGGTFGKTTVAGTAPGSPSTGDLWIDTANGNSLYEWNGTSWVQYQWATGSIAAGAITASQIAAGVIYAGIVNGTTITGATIVADGASGEILVYSGTPAKGNMIASVSATSFTDSHGNVVPAGMNFGTWSASTGAILNHFGVDNAGNTYLANTAGNTVSYGQSSDGTMLFYNASGAAKNNLIMSVAPAAGKDSFGNPYPAGISTTVGTLGSGTTSTGTSVVNPGPHLVYGNASTTTVYLTGSGNWSTPGGVMSPSGVSGAVQVECWGGGAGGATSANQWGGGGGEYACEPNLVVSGSKAYVVGAGGGSASSGGTTTFHGNSVTVTAHGGSASSPPGNGGSGSGNSIESAGGDGGTSTGNGGGGGGASGGPLSAGNPGSNTTGNVYGPGGAAVPGGGPGGNGGYYGVNAQGKSPANGPGGGSGGSGTSGAAPLNAANGQIKITYVTSAGASSPVASLSSFAGTDALGNSYPGPGLGLATNPAPVAVPGWSAAFSNTGDQMGYVSGTDSNTYDTGRQTSYAAGGQSIGTTGSVAVTWVNGVPTVGIGVYHVQGQLLCQPTGTGGQINFYFGISTCTASTFRLACLEYADGSNAAPAWANSLMLAGLTTFYGGSTLGAAYRTVTFDGMITVTGAGTLQMNCWTSTTAGPYTILWGSYFEISPVVA